MTLTDTSSHWRTYSDAFWGSDFRSVAGATALSKRNTEGKRMCQDFEDYLRKRAKVESEYSKSLLGLTKCFRDRDIVGVLEASLVALKDELEVMSRAHQTASEALHKQAEALKKFREEQTSAKKAMEEGLNKAQNAKLQQLNKMLQNQKAYVKKSTERDTMETQCRETSISPQASAKDADKARNRAIKADDDAQRADVAYKSAVMVLENCRVQWEQEMLHSCQGVQELDEERIRYLRQELWHAANVDSKLALDIDNSCEKVREVLEKCDVITDIQAFIESAKTGTDHPEPIVYKHYSKLTSGSDSDSNSSTTDLNPYATVDDAATGVHSVEHSGAVSHSSSHSNSGGGGSKLKMPNILTLQRKKAKKSSSSADEHSH